MTRLLSLLAIPPEIASQYDSRLRAAFPELTINLVDHHSKVGPYIRTADILMTFAPMMNDQVVREATNLKWIQALGTGVDNLVYLPSLRSGVIVTNLQGIHGPPMSEAAIMAMLALSRNFSRTIRNQDRHVWERWPASLLDGKKLGILGIGVIAETLAPKCKALGMSVIGISSTKRTVAGFDRVYGRDELLAAVWNTRPGSAQSRLRVAVLQLRRKIHDDAGRPCFILNEPGLGYRWIGEHEQIVDDAPAR